MNKRNTISVFKSIRSITKIRNNYSDWSYFLKNNFSRFHVLLFICEYIFDFNTKSPPFRAHYKIQWKQNHSLSHPSLECNKSNKLRKTYKIGCDQFYLSSLKC